MRLYGSMATDGNIWEIHDHDDDDDDANFDRDNKYQTHMGHYGNIWDFLMMMVMMMMMVIDDDDDE